MRWSFKIASLFGIPIKVHVTFLLLLVLIAVHSPQQEAAGSGIPSGLSGVILVVGIFFCVVLHELGHSLVARRFGVQVTDITLLPIGGVAKMRTMPHSPRAEFAIAAAGPATSIAIGVLATLAVSQIYGMQEFDTLATGNAPILVLLAVINFVLAVFNLAPAFPMDGGRILRSLLWSRLGFIKATKVAATIGQFLAIALFIFGLVHFDLWLVFIAMFVYFGATMEGQAAALRHGLAQVPASDAMISDIQTISPEELIEQVRQRALHTGQDNFPVFDGQEFIGLLTRPRLQEALRRRENQSSARKFMSAEIVYCGPQDSLAQVFAVMNDKNLSCVVVMQDDQLLGLITPEQIGKIQMLKNDQPGPGDQTTPQD